MTPTRPLVVAAAAVSAAAPPAAGSSHSLAAAAAAAEGASRQIGAAIRKWKRALGLPKRTRTPSPSRCRLRSEAREGHQLEVEVAVESARSGHRNPKQMACARRQHQECHLAATTGERRRRRRLRRRRLVRCVDGDGAPVGRLQMLRENSSNLSRFSGIPSTSSIAIACRSLIEEEENVLG